MFLMQYIAIGQGEDLIGRILLKKLKFKIKISKKFAKSIQLIN